MTAVAPAPAVAVPDRRGAPSRSAVARGLAATGAVAAGAVLATGLATRPAPSPSPAAHPAAAHPGASGWAAVPVEARLAVARGLGADDPAYRVRRAAAGLRAATPFQRLALAFGRTGATVRTSHGSLTLRLVGPAVAPTATANRVTFRRGAVTEWYANGPLGLEQGFTVARPTSTGGRLALDVALGGSLRPRRAAAPGTIDFARAGGGSALRLSGLSATDARGRRLPARLTLHSRRAHIAVDTTGAAFPVTVDPLVQRATLTASDGFANENMGAVAIDGDTIAVGAAKAKVGSTTQGAVYVFTKPASGWADAQQTAKLVASDPTTTSYYGDLLGASVAVSGDTIVAGAPYAPGGGQLNAGRAYVFVEPPSGWTSSVQTAELVASDAAQDAKLGSAVAIDGDTVVATAPAYYEYGQYPGKAYVFTRPANGWTSGEQTATLTASALNGVHDAGGLGASVGISGDTIVAGAPYVDNGSASDVGAAYVWVQHGGVWANAQPQTKLTASAPVVQETLGQAVAVDGGTVVAGAPHFVSQGGDRPPGEVSVFLRPAGGWAAAGQTQAARLTAPDTGLNDSFGESVGVAGDRVVAGGGAGGGGTYVFDRPAAGWSDTTPGERLRAADGATAQGSSVAVADGTVVGSAPYAAGGAGAAEVFEDGAGTTTTPTTTATTTAATTPPDVTTFAVPPGQITNPYVAPPGATAIPSTTDIVAGLFGLRPGSGQTVNLGQFTFVAVCRKPAGQCAGGTSFGQQLGSRGATTTRAKRKTAVLAKGSFAIPAGQRRRVKVKLTRAGRTLLARRHRVKGSLTLTLKLDGGGTRSVSRTLTLKQGRKRR